VYPYRFLVFSISHDNLLKISLCCVYGKKKGPNEINGWRDVAHISWFGIFRRRLSTLAVFVFSQFIKRTCLRYHYAACRKRIGPNRINGWGDVDLVSRFGLLRRRLCTLHVFLFSQFLMTLIKISLCCVQNEELLNPDCRLGRCGCS